MVIFNPLMERELVSLSLGFCQVTCDNKHQCYQVVAVAISIKPDWRPSEHKRSHDSEAETLRRPQTCRGEDKYAGFPALTKEVLETGCKDGAEGIQNFLGGDGAGTPHPS